MVLHHDLNRNINITTCILLHVFELIKYFLQPMFTDTNLTEANLFYLICFYSTDKKGVIL